jgi:hypothetical protein
MALVKETIKVPEQTRIELKSLCENVVSLLCLLSGYLGLLTDLDLWLTS